VTEARGDAQLVRHEIDREAHPRGARRRFAPERDFGPEDTHRNPDPESVQATQVPQAPDGPQDLTTMRGTCAGAHSTPACTLGPVRQGLCPEVEQSCSGPVTPAEAACSTFGRARARKGDVR